MQPGAAAGAVAGSELTLRRAPRRAFTLARRFSSSSMRTVMNLITGSVTRRRRSSSSTTGAIGLDGQQNVVAVVELAHHVGELAPAHLLDRLDHAATVGDGGGKAGDQLVGILFGHIGPNDKHNLIQTGHLVFLFRRSLFDSSPLQLSVRSSQLAGLDSLIPVP